VVGGFSYQGEKGRLERMMPIGGVGLPERERAGASGLGWIPDFGPQVWPSWLPFSLFLIKTLFYFLVCFITFSFKLQMSSNQLLNFSKIQKDILKQ
jgi:hypothetical protein